MATHSQWEQNLVCPMCKGELTIVDSSIECKRCNKKYLILNGVPCFIPSVLDEHQKAELEATVNQDLIRENALSENIAEEPNNFEIPKWMMGKLDSTTVNPENKIICIGGGSGDDLPHVESNFKFNVDHLAHEYIKHSAKMVKQQATQGAIKHIASTSETLPFVDNFADIIFAKNSLDHFNNPLKTMTEINRVLKIDGRFFLSAFYNSSFIDCCETTIIDDDFINNHLKRLFEVEWMEFCPLEEGSNVQTSLFSLPQGRKLGLLLAVCKKKENYEAYNPKILEEYGTLTSNFHAALYWDELFKFKEAAEYYSKVLTLKPLLESDSMRILYSKIRLLSITNHEIFREFFMEFKESNHDAFWWKIVILSSGSFMKEELKKEVKLRFAGDELVFLEGCLDSIAGLGFKRFVKNRKTIYKIVKPFYNLLKRHSKNKILFERTSF
jgi:ubiquinone/menaquinone biosynthesis C-methylase UbiE